MTEAEALEIADTPDWWMGPDGARDAMRTLRAALGDIATHTGRVFLFRPGGFGAPAVWLSAEDIERFRAALETEAERAA